MEISGSATNDIRINIFVRNSQFPNIFSEKVLKNYKFESSEPYEDEKFKSRNECVNIYIFIITV